MSAQKNTLFNYFGKSPAAKSSPNASPAPGTPKTSKLKDSPSTTPKRIHGNANGARAQDSPKSTRCVVREHLLAASPRTRVQRKLLDAAASSSSTYEPHFLRNVLSPQNKKQGQFSSPLKNKENSKRTMMSPVFKALKEHEESTSRTIISPKDELARKESSQPSSDHVIVSPMKCSPRKTVRNLNKEFANSPSKRLSEESLGGKRVKNLSEDAEHSVDVYAVFGQYVAAELRRLNSEKAVRLLKHKIMESILEVQSEQDSEVC